MSGNRTAFVILAGGKSPESMGRLMNGLVAAKEANEAGDEVRLIFDGAGTKGLARISEPHDDCSNKIYDELKDSITGACQYCAQAFGVKDELEMKQIPMLAGYAQHPSIRKLLKEDYKVLTF